MILALPLALTTLVVAANAQQPPAVKSIGTPATNISVAISDPRLAHTVYLEATATAEAVKITAIPLLGPEKVQLTCTVDGMDAGAGIPVTKGTLLPVVLSGHVNKSGKYTGVLTVDSGKDREPLRLSLTVTKTDLPFPLSLISTDAVALADAGPVMVRVSVQEKSGLAQTLNKPEMILLSHRAADSKGKTQVATIKAVPMLSETEAMGAEWAIAAHAASCFLMRVNLCDAGEYTGTIRLTSPSTPAALNVPVTIWVRESAWLAVFLIAAGVIVSAILRGYLGRGRVLLLQQRDTMLLLAEANELRENVHETYETEEAVETVVFDTFMQRIVSLSDRIEDGNADNAETTLDEFRTRMTMIREWIVQRRRIATLPAKIRQKLEEEVAKVTRFLQSDSATELESTRATLRALPGTIDREVRDFAIAVGDELLRRLEAEAPPFGFDETSWPALRKKVEGILRAAPAGDAAQRIRVVQDAFRTYTEGHAAILETFASKQLWPRIDEETNPAKKKTLEDRYDEALELLRTAREAGQTDEFDKASDHLAEAVKKLTTIHAGAPAKRTRSAQAFDFTTVGTAPAAPSLDFGGWLINIVGGLGTDDPRQAKKRADLLKKLVKRLDVVVLVAVLGVAILLGLKLLWADNLVWGSGSDYLVAVLWGLGLHQVTSSTINGLGGVFGQVSV